MEEMWQLLAKPHCVGTRCFQSRTWWEFEAFLNQALRTLYLLNSTLMTDLLLQLSATVCTVSIHHHLTSPTGGWCSSVANTSFTPKIHFWVPGLALCRRKGGKKAKAQEEQFALCSSQGQQVGEGQPFPVAGLKYILSRCWHTSALKTDHLLQP